MVLMAIPVVMATVEREEKEEGLEWDLEWCQLTSRACADVPSSTCGATRTTQLSDATRIDTPDP